MSKLSKVINIFIVFIIIIWMLPLIWMISGALVPTSVITGVSDWTLKSLSLVNFEETFRRKDWLSGFINSSIITIVSTIIIISIGQTCAFGLSRWKKGSTTFLLWLVSTRMLPPAALLVAILLYFQFFRLLDTWASLILVNLLTNLGLFTLLLKSYLDKFDKSFEEHLRTQGATVWNSFMMVSFSKFRMPLLLCIYLCFIFCWNEFLYASSLTAGGTSQTLPVIISGFITGQDIMWGPMFASCTLMVLPAIIAIWFLEKTILKGLTFGIILID